jgi:hypothetical protein
MKRNVIKAVCSGIIREAGRVRGAGAGAGISFAGIEIKG